MTAFEEFIANAIENSPVEASIVRRIYKALEKAGTPVISVFDGEEYTNVSSIEEVLQIVFNLDESYLHTEGSWVRLIMGQDWDTICDYGTSLEDALKPVNSWIQSKM